ncbi:MAG: exosome complex RNA-binding protein Csl4 [Promethearchaeota archaeon]
MKESIKNNEIVTTGQFLGVVEEFLPDKESTFINEGQIFATKTGIVNFSFDKREIQIKSHQEKDRKIVCINDIVIGTILFLRRYSVGLNFYMINNKIHFNSSYFGNIHVSQISNKYIEQISDAFQITDIIRARVIKQNNNEFSLTCIGKDLGVIHADCAICGTTLTKVGFNKLKCEFCGNIESRNIANDYGNLNFHLRF